MIDLILLAFSCGMFVAGWYSHKVFGSADSMVESLVSKVKAWIS